MGLEYFVFSFAVGFCCCFFSISTIIYALLVMLRRGPTFAAVNAVGYCLAQIIWIVITVCILVIFSHFYDPERLNVWWDGLLAAAVLFFLAYRFLVANPKKDLVASPDVPPCKKQYWKQLGAGFMLSITSPQWAVIYTFVLSAIKVVLKRGQFLEASLVGFGLFVGVVVFWVLALMVLRVVHARASANLTAILNRIGAGIMIFLGIIALGDSVWGVT